MTMQTDDDLRDDRFDEAWKRASKETPSGVLDDAIRAAARREVGARPHDVASVPQATRPERWWFPLAAAATIGAIAIGLLQLTTPDKLASVDERRPVSDIPPGAKETAAPRAEVAATPPPAAAPATTSAPAATPATPPAEPLAKQSAESLAKQPTPQPTTRADESKRDRLAPRRQVAAPPLQEQAPAPSVSAAAAPAAGQTKLAAEPQPFPAAKEEAPPAAAPASAPAAPPASAAPVPAQPAPESKKSEAANEPKIVARSAPLNRSAREAALAPKPMLKSQAATSQSVGDSAASDASGALDAVSARAKMRAALPTEQWIVLMRRLLAEQHFDELAKELAAFRTLHADANALLPDDLRNFQPPPAATR